MTAVMRVPIDARSDTSTARPSATVASGSWPRKGRSTAVTTSGAMTAAPTTTTGRIRRSRVRARRPQSRPAGSGFDVIALRSMIATRDLDPASRWSVDDGGLQRVQVITGQNQVAVSAWVRAREVEAGVRYPAADRSECTGLLGKSVDEHLADARHIKSRRPDRGDRPLAVVRDQSTDRLIPLLGHPECLDVGVAVLELTAEPLEQLLASGR